MKKIIKNNIVGFLIGVILATSISVYATLTYNASQIMYTKSNNEEITLDSALNELYTNANIETYTPSGSITPSSNEQILYTANKKIASNITIAAIPNSYKDMETFLLKFSAYSYNTTRGIGSISTYEYSRYFKYIKIDKLTSKTGNEKECFVRAYSNVKADFDNLELSTNYQINSSTDNKNYSSLQVVTSSNNTSRAECQAEILFFN